MRPGGSALDFPLLLEELGFFNQLTIRKLQVQIFSLPTLYVGDVESRLHVTLDAMLHASWEAGCLLTSPLSKEGPSLPDLL